MKVDKKAKGVVQSTLDGILDKPAHMKVYTRDDAMHAVAQLVVCDDQVCKMLHPSTRLLLLLRSQYLEIALLQ
jgi:hypothetical protein